MIESPRTRTQEEQNETKALEVLTVDIKKGLQHDKKSGSNENHAAFQAFKSLAFGSRVKKPMTKNSVSKLVKPG